MICISANVLVFSKFLDYSLPTSSYCSNHDADSWQQWLDEQQDTHWCNQRAINGCLKKALGPDMKCRNCEKGHEPPSPNPTEVIICSGYRSSHAGRVDCGATGAARDGKCRNCRNKMLEKGYKA